MTLKGDFAKSQEGLSGSSPLRSDGSEDSQREAGPHEKHPKALKTKLQCSSWGAISLSPLGSDGCCDGQPGGWTSWDAAKDAQERVGSNTRKLRDFVKRGLVKA